MAGPIYGMIKIEKITIDLNNPRIARIINIYGPNPSAEAVSMALGEGATDPSSSSNTTFASLKESIRTNGGIIQPIIINKTGADEYIVIEGNTRLQIYKGFHKDKVEGNWGQIPAVIYNDISNEKAHAIRLQSHLVGPRDWDPHAKAKYLNYLRSEEQLTLEQLTDFCGGNRNDVLRYIDAYKDMEEYYRPQLREDTFDPKKFSAFMELQNGKITSALQRHGFTKMDFSKWIIEERISPLLKIRILPQVLDNPAAKSEFFKSDIVEASKLLDSSKASGLLLKEATIDQLASELITKIPAISYKYLKALSEDPSYANKKEIINDATQQLIELCDDIKDEV
jgi:hypothetical protein